MDIWALGCCFYEMFTLIPLFPGKNEIDQLHKIHDIVGSPSEQVLQRFKHCNINHIFPKTKPVDLYRYVSNLSTGGIEILQKTLKYHPDCRISAKKLVQHNYFKIFDDAKIKKSVSADRYRNSSSDLEKMSMESTSSRKLSSISYSSFSCDSRKSESLKRLDAVRQRINHERERSWNMPMCPKKTSIINNIRCAVNNSKNTFD
jgi:serine/threonine protein kinase